MTVASGRLGGSTRRTVKCDHGVPLAAVRQAFDYVENNLPRIEGKRVREAADVQAWGLDRPPRWRESRSTRIGAAAAQPSACRRWGSTSSSPRTPPWCRSAPARVLGRAVVQDRAGLTRDHEDFTALHDLVDRARRAGPAGLGCSHRSPKLATWSSLVRYIISRREGSLPQRGPVPTGGLDVMMGQAYENGPTTCMANPRVVKNIVRQIKSSRALSAGDLRLAIAMGMVNADSLILPGFNDGVCYPPTEGPSVLTALQPASTPAKLITPRSNADTGDSGDLFPGSANVTSLTDKTKPSTREFDGTSTGVALASISEDMKTGVITLKVDV